MKPRLTLRTLGWLIAISQIVILVAGTLVIITCGILAREVKKTASFERLAIFHGQKNSGILSRYRAVVQPALARYSETANREEINKVIARMNGGEIFAFQTRNLEQNANLADFWTIRDYFEELGAAVRQGDLDFDFVFQTIGFPDQFWQDTASLRESMKNHWTEVSPTLPDFCLNFEWLAGRYAYERYVFKRANSIPGVGYTAPLNQKP